MCRGNLGPTRGGREVQLPTGVPRNARADERGHLELLLHRQGSNLADGVSRTHILILRHVRDWVKQTKPRTERVARESARKAGGGGLRAVSLSDVKGSA